MLNFTGSFDRMGLLHSFPLGEEGRKTGTERTDEDETGTEDWKELEACLDSMKGNVWIPVEFHEDPLWTATLLPPSLPGEILPQR